MEVNQLTGEFKKKKKWMVLIISVGLLIAGLLDIKYQGLFFQLLPESIQSKIADIY
ncbi:hypothetical protein M3651_05520 [Cytobacillus oceanisediminis]|jgi:uncharacterized membrane protein YiaA|nr:hypothetical protein [Cytobacillus oceanisediminis]